jgi:cytochrome c
MRSRPITAALIGLIALIALLGPAPARASDPCPTATLDSAKALAERAAGFLAAQGAETALPHFMNPAGGFVEGDLYVFVFDLEGRLRASGAWPETVGARIGIDDTGGIYARMRRLALDAGAGWVEYSWYNPCTRKLEPKASYIVRVGEFIVGVGAYKKPGV